jgi:hypothetical protein
MLHHSSHPHASPHNGPVRRGARQAKVDGKGLEGLQISGTLYRTVASAWGKGHAICGEAYRGGGLSRTFAEG